MTLALIRFFGRGGVDPDVCVSAPDNDLERVAGLLFALAPEVGDCVGGVRGFAGEPGAGVLGAGERCSASNGSLLVDRRNRFFDNTAAPDPVGVEPVRPFF